ncbi:MULTISPECIES: HalOD1 output domain-containing protein [Halorubrum]|uniref:HalOD1 output domain-containing protein n=1 Tax=Halorubrum TaxID=56688 RepID=UPI001364B7EC|nr:MULTISPECIES: HalOD1 output domain-containing protein [Halorubrum]
MRTSSEEPLVSITEAVSDALNTPMEKLPPLSQSIDLDGLVEIVTENRSHDVTVTFSYAGHRVLVHSDDTVYVRPIQNDNIGRLNTVYFDKEQPRKGHN